jgi:hypothetical protein
MEYVWTENYFPKDQSEYERWIIRRFEQGNLWAKPIVWHDLTTPASSTETRMAKALAVARCGIRILTSSIAFETLSGGESRKNVVTADLLRRLRKKRTPTWTILHSGFMAPVQV